MVIDDSLGRCISNANVFRRMRLRGIQSCGHQKPNTEPKGKIREFLQVSMQCLVLKYKVMSHVLHIFQNKTMMWDSDHHDHQWLKIVCWIVVQVLEEKDFLFRTSPIDIWLWSYGCCMFTIEWNLWSIATSLCGILWNIVEYPRNLFRTNQAFRPQLREVPKHGTSFEDPSFFIKHIQVATKWPDFLDGILSEQLSFCHKKKRKTDSSFFAEVGNLVTLRWWFLLRPRMSTVFQISVLRWIHIMRLVELSFSTWTGSIFLIFQAQGLGAESGGGQYAPSLFGDIIDEEGWFVNISQCKHYFCILFSIFSRHLFYHPNARQLGTWNFEKPKRFS